MPAQTQSLSSVKPGEDEEIPLFNFDPKKNSNYQLIKDL